MARRQASALELATRALARRGFSERGLRERLARSGVTDDEIERALGELCRAGALDDSRFASSRARALAEGGKGDAAIRFDLERQGLGGEAIEDALAQLEPEQEGRPLRPPACWPGGASRRRRSAQPLREPGGRS
jgi:SOS response regulatory protein OraA/RecX